MIRLTVTFDDQTGRTLFKLAHREMRNPRDQVVYMIKQALAAMGINRRRIALYCPRVLRQTLIHRPQARSFRA